jgi:hypothetical protein
MQHWHLTLDGTICPNVRTSADPTWRSYRPDDNGHTVLGLAECTSPVSFDIHYGTDLCERMIAQVGRDGERLMPYDVLKTAEELEAVISAIDEIDPGEHDPELQAQRNALRYARGWDSAETPGEYIRAYVSDE